MDLKISKEKEIESEANKEFQIKQLEKSLRAE